jgi:NitT/TauT family transport system substrate-binding protein
MSLVTKRLLVLVAASVLAACTGASPTAAPATQGAQATSPPQSPSAGTRDKILIATGVDAGFTAYIVAVEKGFFDKYNIDAEYKPFSDGNLGLDAVLTGDADLGGTSEFPGQTRFAKGGEIYAVAQASSAAKTLGAAGDASIQQPTDLQGKKVGTIMGSSAHYFLTAYAAKYGVDLSKVELVNVPAPDSVAALSNKSISAMFYWDPWLTRTLENVPGTHLLQYSGDNDIYRLTLYTHFGKRLLDNPDLATRVLKALIEAADWIKPNINEAAQIVSTALEIPVDQAKANIEVIDFRFEYDKAAVEQQMANGREFLKSQGVVTSFPDMTNFLHPEFLKAADPTRVTGE